jgi:hypothetical protein
MPLFAQAGIIDTLLLKLAEQGIAGIFCAIFLVVIFFLGRTLLRAKDEMLTKQEKASEALAKSNEANKNLVIEMKDFTSGMLVETTKTQSDVKNALDNQKQELTELKTSVDKVAELKPAVNALQQEQARLATAVNQKAS